jgi:CSLREA domain-containing protein
MRRLAAGLGLLGAAWLLSACDPDAFLQVTVTTTVDGADADPGDGVCEMTADLGDCSLRAAVDEANAYGEKPLVVTVPFGTYTLTLTGTDDDNTGGDLDIDPAAGSLVINGANFVVDAAGGDGGLDARSGSTVVGGFALTGADTAGTTVRSGASLRLINASLHTNDGAGLATESGASVWLANATVSGNTPGIQNAGSLDALFTTVTANTGGGITGTGSLTLEAAIVGDQLTGADCQTAATSQGNNLDSDGTCGLVAPSDIPSTSPDLGALTPEKLWGHVPNSGSPAVDHLVPGTTPCGTPGDPTSDQAGAARPTGSGCDIGAIDVDPALHLVVDTATDAVDANIGDKVCDIDAPPADPGDCSLRAAIDETNQQLAPDTITIAPGIDPVLTLPETGGNSGGSLYVDHGLTVVGDGATVSAPVLGGTLFEIASAPGSPDTIHFDDITLAEAGTSVVATNDRVIVTNSIIELQSLVGIQAADLEITDSIVRANGNAAGSDPGGIEAVELTMLRTEVEGNSGFAGAIIVTGTSTITDSYVHDNAGSAVGGLVAEGAAVTIESSTFAANTVTAPSPFGATGAHVQVGGLVSGSSVVLRNSTLSQGTGGPALVTGLPIIGTSGTAHIEASTIDGGLVRNNGSIQVAGSIVLDGCTGTVTSLGYNLASDATCGFTATGDVQNTNPLLGPLTDNGGPAPTRQPGVGSPARDSIPAGTVGRCDGTIVNDQRGIPRPQGPACDKGSFEQ